MVRPREAKTSDLGAGEVGGLGVSRGIEGRESNREGAENSKRPLSFHLSHL
jgi:hypothetical protein